MSQHSRHKEKGAAGVNLGLIITPMLDMSFQILSFFIMTYHPSALEGHINGNLVPPSTPLIHGKEKNTPTDQPLLADSDPDLEDTLQVIVKCVEGQDKRRKDGEPGQIYLKKKEENEMSMIADADESIEANFNNLESRLKASLAGGALKGNIRLDCSSDLKHKYVMEAYDRCKRAGYQNVSFVAPLAAKKAE